MKYRSRKKSFSHILQPDESAAAAERCLGHGVGTQEERLSNTEKFLSGDCKRLHEPMTLERYVAICMPLRHGELCSRSTTISDFTSWPDLLQTEDPCTGDVGILFGLDHDDETVCVYAGFCASLSPYGELYSVASPCFDQLLFTPGTCWWDYNSQLSTKHLEILQEGLQTQTKLVYCNFKSPETRQSQDRAMGETGLWLAQQREPRDCFTYIPKRPSSIIASRLTHIDPSPDIQMVEISAGFIVGLSAVHSRSYIGQSGFQLLLLAVPLDLSLSLYCHGNQGSQQSWQQQILQVGSGYLLELFVAAEQLEQGHHSGRFFQHTDTAFDLDLDTGRGKWFVCNVHLLKYLPPTLKQVR
ncbi:hypothetical protein EYF80_042797 [Liparis tanakae]|uniref:Uncharacterized protein n=1 Tax=Liparis tanakae TaxID=230148 RepID=A0A4Z2G2B9_9TELE|nr:hypothetical protein EYF80_042797 [Liparis tanakae]